ncbi:MAG: hypothetical protein EZS28_030299, partial [Streblomastix strix]
MYIQLKFHTIDKTHQSLQGCTKPIKNIRCQPNLRAKYQFKALYVIFALAVFADASRMIKLSNDPVTGDCATDGDPKTTPCLCAASAEPDGCTCTAAVHPQKCVCDPESTDYEIVLCEADKICLSYQKPTLTCKCAPDTDTSATYTNAKCEADKTFMAKPVCTETVLQNCRCTEAQQPSGCECPPDDVLDSTYTKTKCEADTSGGSGPTPGTDIGDCTSETITVEGCICVKDVQPKDCTPPETAVTLKDLTKHQCAWSDT